MTSPIIISLTGGVYCQPNTVLPSGCMLTVELSHIGFDGTSRVMAASTTQVTEQAPIPFKLEYDTQEHGTRLLSARIEQDGCLLWTNNTRHEVELSDDHQVNLTINVVQVGA